MWINNTIIKPNLSSSQLPGEKEIPMPMKVIKMKLHLSMVKTCLISLSKLLNLLWFLPICRIIYLLEMIYLWRHPIQVMREQDSKMMPYLQISLPKEYSKSLLRLHLMLSLTMSIAGQRQTPLSRLQHPHQLVIRFIKIMDFMMRMKMATILIQVCQQYLSHWDWE